MASVSHPGAGPAAQDPRAEVAALLDGESTGLGVQLGGVAGAHGGLVEAGQRQVGAVEGEEPLGVGPGRADVDDAGDHPLLVTDDQRRPAELGRERRAVAAPPVPRAALAARVRQDQLDRRADQLVGAIAELRQRAPVGVGDRATSVDHHHAVRGRLQHRRHHRLPRRAVPAADGVGHGALHGPDGRTASPAVGGSSGPEARTWRRASAPLGTASTTSPSAHRASRSGSAARRPLAR